MATPSDSEAIILSIETATLAGSISLSSGRSILGSEAGDSGLSHSNTLLMDIDRLLSKTDIKLSDVDLFAVATGPGSFTGLRIGIATTKALAAALGRPCAGIPTLQAVALAAGESAASVALLPAGRGEVFAQIFSVSTDTVTAMDKAAHISPQKLLEKYGALDNLIWCGEGAHAQKEFIRSWATRESRKLVEISVADNAILSSTGWRLAPRTANLAQYVAGLALLKLLNDEVEGPETLEAIYVRPSDAELKL